MTAVLRRSVRSTRLAPLLVAASISCTTRTPTAPHVPSTPPRIDAPRTTGIPTAPVLLVGRQGERLNFTVGGYRVIAPQPSIAREAFATPIVSATPVANGWVFVTRGGLVAFSTSFDGDLTPLGRIAAGVPFSSRSIGRAVAIDRDGTTWTTAGDAPMAPSRSARGRFLSLAFVDALRGAAVIEGGALLCTTDGGVHWSSERSDASAYSVLAVTDRLFARTTRGPVTIDPDRACAIDSSTEATAPLAEMDRAPAIAGEGSVANASVRIFRAQGIDAAEPVDPSPPDPDEPSPPRWLPRLAFDCASDDTAARSDGRETPTVTPGAGSRGRLTLRANWYDELASGPVSGVADIEVPVSTEMHGASPDEIDAFMRFSPEAPRLAMLFANRDGAIVSATGRADRPRWIARDRVVHELDVSLFDDPDSASADDHGGAALLFHADDLAEASIHAAFAGDPIERSSFEAEDTMHAALSPFGAVAGAMVTTVDAHGALTSRRELSLVRGTRAVLARVAGSWGALVPIAEGRSGFRFYPSRGHDVVDLPAMPTSVSMECPERDERAVELHVRDWPLLRDAPPDALFAEDAPRFADVDDATVRWSNGHLCLASVHGELHHERGSTSRGAMFAATDGTILRGVRNNGHSRTPIRCIATHEDSR